MLLALVVQVASIFWVVHTELTGSAFVSNWALPMPAVVPRTVPILCPCEPSGPSASIPSPSPVTRPSTPPRVVRPTVRGEAPGFGAP